MWAEPCGLAAHGLLRCLFERAQVPAASHGRCRAERAAKSSQVDRGSLAEQGVTHLISAANRGLGCKVDPS